MHEPPLAPLAYATPVVTHTSAWRMTIGIISIVISSLGCLVTLLAIVQIAGMAIMSASSGGSGAAFGTTTVTTNNGTSGSTVVSTSTATTMPAFSFNIPASAWSMALAGEILNLLLNLVLLWAGIALLRRSSRARTMHLWWAGLKFPVLLFYAYGQYLYTDAMFRSFMPATGGMVTPTWPMFISLIIGLMMGIAYPIFLLITLNIRSVRNALDATQSTAVAYGTPGGSR